MITRTGSEFNLARWGISFLALVVLCGGCKKGAPSGADVAEDAEAILTVRVEDQGQPKSNILVQVLDPAGIGESGKTDINGRASFTAQRPGTWTVTVPTQGNFSQSSVEVSVNKDKRNPSVVFSADGQVLAVSPMSLETYGTLGGDIRYGITYVQPGNLALPVTFEVLGQSNPFPSSWDTNLSPSVVGDVTNLAVLAVSIPSGSAEEPTFVIRAKRLDGTVLLDSLPITIRRTFRILTTFEVEQAGNLVGGLLRFSPEIGDPTTQWIMKLKIGQVNDPSDPDFAPLACGTSGLSCSSFSIKRYFELNGDGILLCHENSTQCSAHLREKTYWWVQSGDTMPLTIRHDSDDTKYLRFETTWESALVTLTQTKTLPLMNQDIQVPAIFEVTR